ncbi:DedA family protein [Streptacidiphilus neutrinimicus]|uniref:DedA family protein n=1 Tax=Streptacidiphilus neutrinimicus TaxID=105420 RepID=UPI0005AB1CEF|nr:DedA family protein [Streptacidiphilus neutrinimicus]
MSAGAGLPGALAHLQPLLDRGGYYALALLVALDNILVPVPGQTMLIVAAVYAGTGRMNVVAVACVAWVAAVVAAEAAYVLGRWQGVALVHRYGRYVRLTEARYARAEDYYRRRGVWIVLVARFIDVLRQTNGVLAGVNQLPRRRFTTANAAGAALWTATWTALGYTAGADIGPLYRQALRYQLWLLGAVAVVAVALVCRSLLRRRRDRRRRDAAGDPAGDPAGDAARDPDGE